MNLCPPHCRSIHFRRPLGKPICGKIRRVLPVLIGSLGHLRAHLKLIRGYKGQLRISNFSQVARGSCAGFLVTSEIVALRSEVFCSARGWKSSPLSTGPVGQGKHLGEAQVHGHPMTWPILMSATENEGMHETNEIANWTLQSRCTLATQQNRIGDVINALIRRTPRGPCPTYGWNHLKSAFYRLNLADFPLNTQTHNSSDLQSHPQSHI